MLLPILPLDPQAVIGECFNSLDLYLIQMYTSQPFSSRHFAKTESTLSSVPN
jgi:hypothetical protein